MVAPKLRFEVFKRDGFTCQYCGRKTPVVVLEVDHITPKARDGKDDLDNLTTSCWECNRGKGDGLLPEPSQESPREPTPDELHDRAVLLLERERQLAEYGEVKRAVRERQEAEVEDLICYWDRLAGDVPCGSPNANILNSYIRDLPAEDIKDIMAGAWALGDTDAERVASHFCLTLDMRRKNALARRRDGRVAGDRGKAGA